MTTRFPVDNLAPEMQEFRRVVEAIIHNTENSQQNVDSIVTSMRQSIGSSYGIGETLLNNAGSLSNKVFSDLQNYQGSPASSIALQRSWTNFGGTLTVTSPPFVSNLSLAVACTSWPNISGGGVGATYSQWTRLNVSGAVTGNKMIPRTNFGQILFFWPSVPASSNITIRTQIWGFIQNTNNTFVDGTVGTASIVRMSTAVRATALV